MLSRLRQRGGWIPTYDDWYVCDNSGPVNNNFLGDVQVGLLLPNAAGDAAGWTGSGGGAHYGYVDENPLDSDASYVETDQSGAEELWNYQDPVSCPFSAGDSGQYGLPRDGRRELLPQDPD